MTFAHPASRFRAVSAAIVPKLFPSFGREWIVGIIVVVVAFPELLLRRIGGALAVSRAGQASKRSFRSSFEL